MWFSNVNNQHVFVGLNGMAYGPMFQWHHDATVFSESREAALKVAQECADQWPGSKVTSPTYFED